MNTNTDQRHDTIAAAALAGIVGLAGLAALLDTLLATLPDTTLTTGHPALVGSSTTVLAVLAVLAVLVGGGRWAARRVRERREDAADLIAGAAWRAEHMPHFAAQIEHDHRRRGERAGVA